jgi:hypothetical protein
MISPSVKRFNSKATFPDLKRRPRSTDVPVNSASSSCSLQSLQAYQPDIREKRTLGKTLFLKFHHPVFPEMHSQGAEVARPGRTMMVPGHLKSEAGAKATQVAFGKPTGDDMCRRGAIIQGPVEVER